MNNTTMSHAGGSGDVIASSDGAKAPSRTTLRTPTSEKTEPKIKKQRQPKKMKKPEHLTIEIPKEKKEEEEMKQPSIKEFLEFAKMKNENKDNEKFAEEEKSEVEKNPDNKSREATIMEVFNGICHVKEYIHSIVKANDDKWKAMKRIDDKRIDALVKTIKSQDTRIS